MNVTSSVPSETHSQFQIPHIIYMITIGWIIELIKAMGSVFLQQSSSMDNRCVSIVQQIDKEIDPQNINKEATRRCDDMASKLTEITVSSRDHWGRPINFPRNLVKELPDFIKGHKDFLDKNPQIATHRSISWSRTYSNLLEMLHKEQDKLKLTL